MFLPRKLVGATALTHRRSTWSAVVFLVLLVMCASATTPVARAGSATGGTTADQLGGATGVEPAKLLATVTVNTTADHDDGTCDSDCTLREAINYAGSGDTISFASGLAGGTIALSLGQLTLSQNVTIDASALASPITISGNNGARVFDVNTPGVYAALIGLTITKGLSNQGSGIYNYQGTVTVTTCTVSNNDAGDPGTPGRGGGIYNYQGKMTVTNSTFSGNRAYSFSGTPGHGGGIFNDSGTVTVTKSTFSGNHTDDPGQGGGIYNLSGTLTVTNSTFSSNSGGRGGGILNWQSTATVTNSTFSGNVATPWFGGGIYNGGTGSSLTVTNSTLSANSADYNPNGGGGLFGGAITLYNTIVANSPSGGNCSNAVTDGGNNIDSGTTCGWGAANGSMSNTDPLLTALGNYGGPTQTMAILSTSPARDGVTYNSPNGSPATDQRGVARPKGSGYDIGAYEYWADGPGAVQLARFEARRSGQVVVLAWETATEIKNAGFRVLRQESDGQLTNLTPRLIPPGSAGGELGGAHYTFTDQSAPREATLYWLEDVDTLGNATRHGPVEAPAYRLRPIPRPMPPGGVLDGLTDPQAPQVEAALDTQGELK
jgi:fibronectin-binding autotransporter adhesin